MERCFLVIAKLKMKVYCHFNYNIFMWWCNQWSIKSFENKFFQIIQRWRCIHHMPGYCWQLNEMYMQFVVFFLYISNTLSPQNTPDYNKKFVAVVLYVVKNTKTPRVHQKQKAFHQTIHFSSCAVCVLFLWYLFLL